MSYFKKVLLGLFFTALLGVSGPTPFVHFGFAEDQSRSAQTIEQVVYITKTGHKYHRAGCRYLRYSAIPVEKSKAQEMYGACKVCRP